MTTEERYRQGLEFINKTLVELQKVIHACADPKIRDDAYHCVIELRSYVRLVLDLEQEKGNGKATSKGV